MNDETQLFVFGMFIYLQVSVCLSHKIHSELKRKKEKNIGRDDTPLICMHGNQINKSFKIHYFFVQYTHPSD